MLLKVDAAQLEWRVKVFLAQDRVGMDEIVEMEAGRFDIHTDNQEKFNLPSRVIAKNFVYQAIFQDAFGDRGFHGAASGFAAKADFQHVFPGSKKKAQEQWYGVVETFFNKYKGIHEHSKYLIREATEKGRIEVPSGRFWTFKPEVGYDGNLAWPITKILNYPIQGFSADLVQVARLNLWKETEAARLGQTVLLVNTVHDDIEADVDNNPEVVYNTCIAMEQAFHRIPEQFKKLYGSEINVPMAGEVKFGVNLNEASMVKFKKATFEKDYKDYIAKHGNQITST